MILDAVRGELEELRHTAARDLGIGAGDERRRADEVNEECSCQLAFDTGSLPKSTGRPVATVLRGRAR